jgi:hypothetical protein
MILPNAMLPFFSCWIGNRFVTVISKHRVQLEMQCLILLDAHLFHKQSSRIASVKINECQSRGNKGICYVAFFIYIMFH